MSTKNEAASSDQQEAESAVAQDPQPIPNVSWFARGYNLLTIDLFKLSNGASSHLIFDLDSTETTADGSTLVPVGANYIPPTGGYQETATTFLMTAYDTQEESAKTASVSGGTPAVAFSGSGSYSTMEQESGSQSTMETFTEYHVCGYQLEWDFQHENEITLDSHFASDVLALDTADGVSYDDAGDVTAIGDDFENFIDTYGTHFAASLTLGGQAYQRIQIENETLSSMTLSNVDVSAEASGLFKGVTGGGSYSESDSVFESEAYASGCTVNSVQCNGGTLTTDLDAWAATVADDPEPVMVELQPLSDLLVSSLFTGVDDSQQDLSDRQQLLSDAIDFYISTNGRTDGDNLICFGDTLRLDWQGKGGGSLDNSLVNSLYVQPTLDSDEAEAQSFVLKNPADLDSTDRVVSGDLVVLQSVFNGMYVCRDGGTQQAPGGTPSASQTGDPSQPEVQWTVYSGWDDPFDPQLADRYIHVTDEIFLLDTESGVQVLSGTDDGSYVQLLAGAGAESRWGLSRLEASGGNADPKYATIGGTA